MALLLNFGPFVFRERNLIVLGLKNSRPSMTPHDGRDHVFAGEQQYSKEVSDGSSGVRGHAQTRRWLLQVETTGQGTDET